MKLIDGRLVSATIQKHLLDEVKELKKHNIVPTLAIIQLGSVCSSNVYVRNKMNLANKVGINVNHIKLPTTITTNKLLSIINKLNLDKNTHGILVQLPLPASINERSILSTISPNKDVDCFHLENIGRLWSARKEEVHIKPCTPGGIIELLKYYHIPIAGKNAIIIGRSNIVGKPMASLLLLEDATVTFCHSKSTMLNKICKKADILICAVGKPNFIDNTYVKKGACVIDVGINSVDGKICGDVDFGKVSKIAKYLSPVPGGVGPMTITILMKNLIYTTKLNCGLIKNKI